MAVMVTALVIVPSCRNGPRSAQKPKMSMRANVRMSVDMASMSMYHARIRAAHPEHRSRILVSL
jgi:hypothetical protein